MKNVLIVTVILVYVFSSAFLESGPGGRVTVSDLVLVGIIFMAVLSGAAKNTLRFPHIYAAAAPMFLVFLMGAIFATQPDLAAFELLVILFSFFGGIAIVNLLLDLPANWIKRLISGYVITIGLISFLCLLDFFVMPGLVSSRQLGGIQGPFRNTGQAGSFFGVHAVLVLSMLLSRLVPRSAIFVTSAALALFALIFTFKRASILAVVAGISFLAIFMVLSGSARDKRIGAWVLSGIFILGILGFTLFNWALDEVPGMRWRFEHKFSTDVLDDIQTGFLAENIASAVQAFQDRPLLGVGLGNVNGVYQDHEIHSTYLGILAYGGILGIISYVYFMSALLHSIYRGSKLKLHNAWSAFLYYLLPLLLGQMIGWGYTNHTRKREFWILVVFVAAAVALTQRQKAHDGHTK